MEKPCKQHRLWKRVVFVTVTLVLISTIIFLCKTIFVKEGGFVHITDQLMKIRVKENILSKDGIPLSVKNADNDDKWGSGNYIDIISKEFFNTNKSTWMKITIPDMEWEKPALFVSGHLANFKIYADKKLIHIFDSGEKLDKIKWRWHIIPLDSNIKDEYIIFQIDSIIYPDTITFSAFGEKDNLLNKILKTDIPILASGILFFSIGLFAILLFLKNMKNRIIIAFAAFCIGMGIFVVSDTIMRFMIFDSLVFWRLLYFDSLLMMPVLIAIFVQFTISEKYKKIMKTIWLGHFIFSVLATGATVVFAHYGNLMVIVYAVVIYSIMTITSLITIAIILAKEARKGNEEANIFFTGFLVLALVTIINLLFSLFLKTQAIGVHWGMLVFIIFIGKLLYMRFENTQKQLGDYAENLEEKVHERTSELEEANEELTTTVEQIKNMQNQLITQQKLASLGALTAGIAHEIKNPLNFVNNFAEISVELVEEVKDELETQKTKMDKEVNNEIHYILDNLEENVKKINHHGKRADSIVQSMLLHSRGKSGDFRMININHLLDEYLNLAYHGMRAKDTNFNVTIEKTFDSSLHKINVVPQDISRVFLNLLNNSFYAVNEKSKETNKDFEPMLWATTKATKTGVEISIKDNGTGIPLDVVKEIFNPFFTTKPTGEGTGLGLSISYDIITHEHMGKLQVKTKDGEYTEFIITLPKGK